MKRANLIPRIHVIKTIQNSFFFSFVDNLRFGNTTLWIITARFIS